MTQLTDHSSLKRGGTIKIPLNGEVYEAMGDPPAEIPLESLGALDADDLGTIAKVMQLHDAGADLEAASAADPSLLAAAAKAAGAGMQSTRRALRMLEVVLLPDSLERWQANMRPPDPKWAKAKQTAHRDKMITLQQVMAVYQDLMKEYGRRPTSPSLSSTNGHGGTGGTSTAGAPAGA
jgi:hypothetical protein